MTSVLAARQRLADEGEREQAANPRRACWRVRARDWRTKANGNSGELVTRVLARARQRLADEGEREQR